ncbi:GtrA family protein [Streptomyces specialis]|uniref:GtrA family protein n=1 Tax=Streptomyces specialis TaxID=498367 RepID=UPI00099E5149|nr:GtrA family protein [Streptomyces specialis]
MTPRTRAEPRRGAGLPTPRRLRPKIAELGSFGLVGAVAFAVDTAGGNVLHFGLGLDALTSKVCSTTAATLVAYAGNRWWTFRHRDVGSVRRYPLFLLLNVVGLAIALLCLAFTRDVLGLAGPLAYNLSANVVGTGLGTAFRYWSYRRWVFPERRSGAVATGGARPAPQDRLAAVGEISRKVKSVARTQHPAEAQERGGGEEGEVYKRQVWRSPDGQPRWARPALLAVAALAAALYCWNLSSSDYATYYSVAARSMSESWEAFFFTALDPSATITLDKIGGFLWPEALSARIFGYSAWSLTLPHCVAGVVTVLVTYRVVRRWQGPEAGLLAAALTALTPLLASLFGNALLDGMLTMCLVLAADAYQRAVRDGRLRPLLLAAFWIGLGFQTKMLQAWLIVPAVALAYLVTAPVPVRTRVRHTLAAGVVLLGVSLSWVGLMTLTPADSRPYADGSTNDSAIAMVFGYNGLGRLGIEIPGAVSAEAPSTTDGPTGTAGTTGPPRAAPPAAPGDGAAAGTGTGPRETGPDEAAADPPRQREEGGWLKLVGDRLGTQIAWLFPIALLSLAHGLARRRRDGERYADQARGGYLFWGLWLVTSVAVLSAISVPHTGYAAVLAPPLAALSAAGTVSLWRSGRRLPAALVIAAQTCWCGLPAADHRDWVPWLLPLLITAALGALGALWWSGRAPGRRRIAVAGLIAGCVGMYAAPTAWSLSVLDEDYGGSSFDAAAGPALPGGTGGALPGAEALTAEQERLLAYVEERNGDGVTYTFSTDTWSAAAPYIQETGSPVLPLGGFGGQAASVTVEEYQELVENGDLRFALVGTATTGTAATGTAPGGAPPTGGPRLGAAAGASAAGAAATTQTDLISAWVRSACVPVEPAEYGSTAETPTLYACAPEGN